MCLEDARRGSTRISRGGHPFKWKCSEGEWIKIEKSRRDRCSLAFDASLVRDQRIRNTGLLIWWQVGVRAGLWTTLSVPSQLQFSSRANAEPVCDVIKRQWQIQCNQVGNPSWVITPPHPLPWPPPLLNAWCRELQRWALHSWAFESLFSQGPRALRGLIWPCQDSPQMPAQLSINLTQISLGESGLIFLGGLSIWRTETVLEFTSTPPTCLPDSPCLWMKNSKGQLNLKKAIWCLQALTGNL